MTRAFARSSLLALAFWVTAGLTALACAEAPRRLSIVIVVFDAARADHFNGTPAMGLPFVVKIWISWALCFPV